MSGLHLSQRYKDWQFIQGEEHKEQDDDLISRQAVIDACEQSIGILEAVDRIMDLPSVEQEPKTGNWIEKDGFDGDVYYDCSECGESWTTIEGTPWDNKWDYCPSCGARMVEPQERSE